MGKGSLPTVKCRLTLYIFWPACAWGTVLDFFCWRPLCGSQLAQCYTHVRWTQIGVFGKTEYQTR